MTISDNSDGLPIIPRITYLTDDRLYSDTAEESDKILKNICVLNVVCVIKCICVFYYCSAMLDIYPVITYPNQVTDLVLINVERVSVVSLTLSDANSGHVILPNTYLIVPISHIANMKVYFVLSLSFCHVLYLYINYL